MDEEKLIECVRKYAYLYDVNHPKYTDSIKKESTWKEIGQKLKQPTDTCKQRWQSLRDCFRRTLNKRKTMNGAKSRRKWRYEEEMEFLTPYFARKNTQTPVDASSEEETVDTAIKESVYAEQSIDSSSSDAVAASDDTVAGLVITPHIASAVANNNTCAVTRKRKAKCMKIPIMNTSSALMTTCSSDEKGKKICSDYDELDHFFFNISATVRKFTPYQQAIAKNKIFSLVSDIEIQQFAATNYDNTTPSPASTNWTLPASSAVSMATNDWKEEQNN